MPNANATSQTEITSLGDLSALIGLGTDFKWKQVPLDLFQESLSIAKTANYTMTTADNGMLFHNTGASGTVVITLPAAVVGLQARGHVRASRALRFAPNGSEIIGNPTAGSADGTGGQYIGSSTVGAAIHLVCLTAGRWEVQSVKGTWVIA